MRIWAFFGLLAGVSALSWSAFRRPLPRTSGRLRLPGLEGPVTVERDARGTPTIRASSHADALRAQGFVHAQDRYFQMELQRAGAGGRLSGLFGARCLSQDRFLRRLSLEEAARAEWDGARPEERRLLTAYAEGVNHFLRTCPRPSEMVVLGLPGQPWEGWHALLWVKMMGHDLSCNWEGELFRTRLAQSLEPEQAALWSLSVGPGLPVTCGGRTGDSYSRLVEEFRVLRPYVQNLRATLEDLPVEPRPQDSGSNAWAVSGRLTRSGKPLLANDPHLVMRLPSYWYQMRLVYPEADVQGATMPGMPGIVLGHNQHLAWGVTNAYVDNQDLFLEELRRAGAGWEARTPDGWRALEEHGPHQLPWTRHGPLLSEIRVDPEDPSRATALALAWTGRLPGHFFSALFQLNRARRVEEAQDCLVDWGSPNLSFVLADQERIGYQLVGRIPRRRRGSGLVPVPGWLAEYDWDGVLDYAEQSRLVEPECGFVVSANHSLDNAMPHLSWDFNPGLRAERIEQLLRTTGPHDLDSMLRIQLDCTTLLGQRLRDACAVLRPADERERQALGFLREWDGRAGRESVGACLYELLLVRLAHAVFEPALGHDFARDMLGEIPHSPMAPVAHHASRYHLPLVDALERRDERWLPAGKSWEELLAGAFTQTVSLLVKRLGPDPRDWRWGRLHRMELRHPLGRLSWLFPSLGPAEVDGDSESVAQTGLTVQEGWPGLISVAAPWRIVIDLERPEASRSGNAPGQSGHPASRHYQDGWRPWLEGRSFPFRGPTVASLRLEP